MARYAKFFSVGGGAGTNNLQLPVGTVLDTTLRQVQDGLGTGSPLYISTLRLGITSDPSVTTQTSSVIQATTTNANLVIAPNGTGALIASIPDGTPTGGGNARGQYAVDLKLGGRTAQTQVASGNYSVVLGGNVATASGTLSIAGGSAFATGTNSVALGGSSTASGSGSVAIGGEQGGGLGATASGRTAIAFGMGNQATADWSNSLGGINNIASSQFSTVSGGQTNTASTGTHATVVGGSTNTSSGQNSVSGGVSNTASGFKSTAFGNSNSVSGNTATSIGYNNTVSGTSAFASGGYNTSSGTSSICLGDNNFATNTYSFAVGNYSDSYLYQQNSFASGVFANLGDAQQSFLTTRKQATLTTGGTTVLSLDGTGVTNLIIPKGVNGRMWNVTIKYIAVVTTITGTATGVTVGDTKSQNIEIGFKKLGGVSSLVGGGSFSIPQEDASMGSASLIPTAGASQELALTFTAPTFAGGGSVTCRVVAKVELVEVAF